MAAITPISFSGAYKVIRNEAEQADTGQTDWINVPPWAKWVEVFINVTAVVGTTPILTPYFYMTDPNLRDDSYITPIHGDFTSPPTAASMQRILIGPGLAVADDLALGGAGHGQAVVNIPLPPLLGVRMLMDRTTGDETYTYTVTVNFRS